MNYLNEIDERFPVRRRKAQKQAFAQWAVSEARALGYEARVRADGRKGKHANIEIGNAETAMVVFTAHYDTPGEALFPNLMMPLNPIFKRVYGILSIMVFMAVGMAAGFIIMAQFATETFNYYDDTRYAQCVLAIFLAVYMFLFLRYGNIAYPNKHNKNDNTSGVSAVFSLMERLPESARKNVAFLLFDNEEYGCCGSAAFAKGNPAVKEKTLIVNMDCVGNGSDLVAIVSDKAKDHAALKGFSEKLGAQGMPLHLLDPAKSRASSDHRNFDRSVALMACNRGKLVRFLTPRIHTKYDTVASAENIDRIAKGLSEFVQENI